MSNPSIITLVRKLPTKTYWKRRRGKNPSHVKRQLKKQNLKDHIEGLFAVGLAAITPGTNTTQVALFDLDNHSGDDVGVHFRKADIVEAAKEYGLEPTVFSSSGGKGVHIYFIWDEPQDAYSVRQLMTDVLTDCLLLPGTAGLEENQVEIFPKQDSVAAEDYGSMFILPYAFESEWLAGNWLLSDAVPVLDTPPLPRTLHDETDQVSFDLVTSAIEALPNVDLDYDAWRNIIFSLHAATDGSDAGLELARKWSSKSDKHDDDFLCDRVWPYVKPGKGITARTLLARAHESGWEDDIKEMFDDLGEDDSVVSVEQPMNGAVQPAKTSGVRKSPDTTEVTTLPGFRRDNKGAIEATVGNLEAALRASMSGGTLGFDDFTQQQMVKHKGEWVPLGESSNVTMRIALESQGFKPISKDAFRDVLFKVCEEVTFDSAADWLRSLKWDGVPRVDAFLTSYFGAKQSAYHEAVSRYWWSALAGRVCVPGIQTDMVPVLVGPQGAMKSTALARMVPQREQIIEIDLTARDDDLSRIMQGVLIGEIAELRGLNSRDDEHIKAFITRTQEKWVPKYKEYPRIFNRRLLFVGTTNHEEFLSDHTGNRRWLPIAVGTIDRDRIETDRDQLWAEGAALFDEHGVIYANAEKLANVAQIEFEIEDPWERTIAHYLREAADDFEPDPFKSPNTRPRVAANEVLTMSGAAPDLSRVNRGHHMRLARIFRKLGWSPLKCWDNSLKMQVRLWEKKEDELV